MVKIKVFVYDSVTGINLWPERVTYETLLYHHKFLLPPNRAGTQFQTDCVNVGQRLRLSICHPRIGRCSKLDSNSQPAGQLEAERTNHSAMTIPPCSVRTPTCWLEAEYTDPLAMKIPPAGFKTQTAG